MHNGHKKNKLIIDKLLNTYSIDAIISSFHSIDEKIIAIIKFSSEDFVHLSSIFRKYHQEINLLSSNLFRLFAGFNKTHNSQHATAIRDSMDKLHKHLHAFEAQIVFNKKIHERVLQKLEQLFVPVNNFYQDLSTLKYLSASLKLDPIMHGQHGDKINHDIEDIFLSYPNFIDNLKKVKKFVSNSFIATDSLKKNYLDNIYHIISFCKNITDTILDKQQQADEYKPVLDNILSQTKESGSLIITYLQYQDIIKQKIEHVKHIHNEIINKLSVLVDKANEPDFKLTRAKLFLQIKEIAHLQSAQMIHANHEYHKAVEIITAEFLHLSDHIRDIHSLHLSFSTPERIVNDNDFDADLNIRREANLYNEIDAINNIFKLQTEGIIQRIANFSNCFTLIFKTCTDFLHVINTIKQQHNMQNGNESASIIIQMSTVAEELVKTITFIKSISEENMELTSMLQRKYEKEYLANGYESLQKQEVRMLSNAFREINYLNRELLQVCNTKATPFDITGDLKDSIESVRYYEHFENEITHIISCLNEISDRMKSGDTMIMEDEKETINTLR
ncbi:MAG: hypothetical protein JW973_09795 [Bacteroidales bacterium]|nr:hypothetical protein [Bacteroidales bacterium]